ncbi:PqqD family peptide modification chaperone [Lachnospiraceae bacterium OttesenSCG-928-D06]|nr:PqqD family peptide modification chaperone [Lachnospiraceae bacterium OttesenSCG-928-D06]
MDRNTVIKVKRKINVTDLSGEKVMVDFETGKYYMIKGSGNDIWDLVQEEITVEEVISKLLVIYEVSEKECEDKVIEFLERMRKLEIIE